MEMYLCAEKMTMSSTVCKLRRLFMLHVNPSMKKQIKADMGLPQPWGQFKTQNQKSSTTWTHRSSRLRDILCAEISSLLSVREPPYGRGCKSQSSTVEERLFPIPFFKLLSMQWNFLHTYFFLLWSFLYSFSSNFWDSCSGISPIGMILFKLLLPSLLPLHPAENSAGRIIANSFACLPIRSILCQSQVINNNQ